MYFQSEKDMLCTTEYKLWLLPRVYYTASPLSSLKNRTQYQTENKAEHYKTCVVFSSFHFNPKAIHAYSFFSVRAGRENKTTNKKQKKNKGGKENKIPNHTFVLSLQELKCCNSATNFQRSGRKHCGRTLTSPQFCLPVLHAYMNQWYAEALHPSIVWRTKAHLRTRNKTIFRWKVPGATALYLYLLV